MRRIDTTNVDRRDVSTTENALMVKTHYLYVVNNVRSHFSLHCDWGSGGTQMGFLSIASLWFPHISPLNAASNTAGLMYWYGPWSEFLSLSVYLMNYVYTMHHRFSLTQLWLYYNPLNTSSFHIRRSHHFSVIYHCHPSDAFDFISSVN